MPQPALVARSRRPRPPAPTRAPDRGSRRRPARNPPRSRRSRGRAASPRSRSPRRPLRPSVAPRRSRPDRRPRRRRRALLPSIPTIPARAPRPPWTARGERLERAVGGGRSGGAFPQPQLTDVAGVAGDPGHRRSVDDQPAADARRDDHREGVAGPTAAPRQCSARARQAPSSARRTGNCGRSSCTSATIGRPAERGEVQRRDRARGEVDGAGRADRRSRSARSSARTSARASAATCLTACAISLPCGIPPGRRAMRRFRDDVTVGIDERGIHLRAAEVDREGHACVRAWLDPGRRRFSSRRRRRSRRARLQDPPHGYRARPGSTTRHRGS